MNDEHLPRTCKWASPTLFLSYPQWLDAWSWEWSCDSHGAFRALPNTSACRQCPRWEPREVRGPVAGSGDRSCSDEHPEHTDGDSSRQKDDRHDRRKPE